MVSWNTFQTYQTVATHVDYASHLPGLGQSDADFLCHATGPLLKRWASTHLLDKRGIQFREFGFDG